MIPWGHDGVVAATSQHGISSFAREPTVGNGPVISLFVESVRGEGVRYARQIWLEEFLIDRIIKSLCFGQDSARLSMLYVLHLQAP